MASSIDAPRNDVNPVTGLNPAAPNTVDSISVKVDKIPDVVKVSMVNVMLNWVREKIVDPVRNSAFVKSRAVQITVMVLGVILVAGGLVLLLTLHSHIGNTAFLFIIPAVVGLIKLLITSFCLGESCSLEKWKVFRDWAGVLEDQFDNGVLDGSNQIFVDSDRDNRRPGRGGGEGVSASGALEQVANIVMN